jgi:hypothetical protein
MKLDFRALTPDDVKVRIGGFTELGVELLVYKNARVDANILDEAVGPENWQCIPSPDLHSCTISIWDDDKKCWVSKGDAGDVRSGASCPNKEIASDAFKRAGTKWGIGRELYNLPKILVACATKKGPKGYVPVKYNDPLLFGMFVDTMTFAKKTKTQKGPQKLTKLVIKNGYGDILFSYDSKKGIIAAETPDREIKADEVPMMAEIPAIDFEDGECELDFESGGIIDMNEGAASVPPVQPTIPVENMPPMPEMAPIPDEVIAPAPAKAKPARKAPKKSAAKASKELPDPAVDLAAFVQAKANN